MIDAMTFLGGLAWLLACAAVLLGRNLTRSILACYAFLGCLCIALLVARAGTLAILIAIVSLVSFVAIQLSGWMLVEIDRDRLTPTDAPTWTARVLAFALLGAGLWVLGWAIAPSLARLERAPETSLVELGRALFGPLDGAVLLLGCTIGAALLGAMLMLRGEREGK